MLAWAPGQPAPRLGARGQGLPDLSSKARRQFNLARIELGWRAPSRGLLCAVHPKVSGALGRSRLRLAC